MIELVEVYSELIITEVEAWSQSSGRRNHPIQGKYTLTR